MGTYSGFLLLEDLFDNLPEDSQTLYNESQQLFNPSVKVVEADCSTKLGKKINLDFSAIGLWDLALDARLTSQDIEFYLSQGSYSRYIRHPAYCISKGGVCKKCHDAWMVGSSASVGETKKFPTEIITGTQTTILSGGDPAVVIAESPENYTRIQVYYNDLYTTNYVITETEDGLLRVNMNGVTMAGDTLFIRLFMATASPFMTYLSKSYSGNLLGALPIETGDLPLRTSLMKERITGARIDSLQASLEKYAENVPPTYLEYSTKIKDPLERELYILALYGVFYDVGV